jgi:hypothetical protein
LIWGEDEANYFFARDWTGQIKLNRFGKLGFTRKGFLGDEAVARGDVRQKLPVGRIECGATEPMTGNISTSDLFRKWLGRVACRARSLKPAFEPPLDTKLSHNWLKSLKMIRELAR